MKTGTVVTKPKNVKRKKKATKAKATKTKKCQKYLKIRCPICFNNISNEAVSSTQCGHVFCTRCLQKALQINSVCPTCRKSLRKTTGYHALYLNDNIYEEDLEIDSC
ncbi:hypothetical protein evm_000558 [Chilo suppressalis]|nr:hypothetical protein evm_000558 [Chilo suppressalis]